MVKTYTIEAPLALGRKLMDFLVKY